MKQYYTFFAQAYGEGTYSACTYNDATSCTSTGTSGASNTSGSGTLTNTGFDILLIITVACTLIFTALIVRLWRKKNRAKQQIPAAEPVEVEDDNRFNQPRS